MVVVVVAVAVAADEVSVLGLRRTQLSQEL